jgi:N6-L-threonylcarbamoyladenine synthase
MNKVNILAIETSCDDTSAAVLQNNVVLSNIIANQEVHRQYGGVVPELASRAHQQHIIPVVHQALLIANIHKNNLNAIAFTRGPGLLGSLLVGFSFAKAMSQALNVPLIEADHLNAHIYALFLDKPDKVFPKPPFPFLALLVSGGHTRIGIVRDFLDIEFIGDTIDDAAGEAFDKAAKIMGLQYPGGPVIDKLAKTGNPTRFRFSKPNIPEYNFSFSGLKTSFLYFIRDALKKDAGFISQNLNDLCASIQHTIVEILLEKMQFAVKKTGISNVAVAGGVSANSCLKHVFQEWGKKNGIGIFFPDFGFTTDNAAMIGMLGYLKYQKGLFAPPGITPYANNDK